MSVERVLWETRPASASIGWDGGGLAGEGGMARMGIKIILVMSDWAGVDCVLDPPHPGLSRPICTRPT